MHHWREKMGMSLTELVGELLCLHNIIQKNVYYKIPCNIVDTH